VFLLFIGIDTSGWLACCIQFIPQQNLTARRKSMNQSARVLSRRQFLAAAGGTVAGAVLLAACAPAAPGAAPAAAGEQPAAGAEAVEIHAHMVEKQDVSQWIQMGLDQDIDGFVSGNPDLKVVLDTIPGWTAEYIPKILSFTAAGTLGDAVWYPPRHRSHIAWGTSYGIVTDLNPLAEGAGYDLGANFFEGANNVNSFEGKQYWLSYISEPIVPVIAYNKTKAVEMGIGEPSDDWTFDELAEWAQQGTTEDVFGYYRADRGGVFSGGPYLRQHGVEPTDAEGKKATFLDSQEAFVQALQFDYDLLNTWKVSPSPAAGAINAPELFGGQKVLAVDIWPFRIQIYADTFKDFEIGFVLTPVVNKGDARRSMLNEHVFGLTTASKNPDAAFKFLTWIAGHEMNVQAVIQGQKGPIARADFWADDRVYEKQPTYAKLRPIMESIEPDFNVANFRGEEFDAAYGAVLEGMELAEKTPEEAAIEIQEACQAVLDKEPA
jgi:multiple sugar transport system substrate-binding protein